MKRNFLKIFISLAVLLLLVAILSLGAMAAPSVKVTYIYDGSVHNALVDSGKSFVPLTPALDLGEGSFFYGWADAQGNVYAAGKSVSLTKDTTLYALKGKTVQSSTELFDALENGNNCIKLGTHVTVNKSINLGNGAYAIDTNYVHMDIE